MAARVTNAQILAALTTLDSRLSALEAPAPVTSAPVKAQAESPFIAYQRDRHAAQTSTPEGFEACGVHAVCTRSFKVGSNGATTHEPRVYAADGSYTIGS